MNCKQCGAILQENEQFCKNCGTSVNINNNPIMNMFEEQQQNPNTINNYQQQVINDNKEKNKKTFNKKIIVITTTIIILIIAIVSTIIVYSNEDNNLEITTYKITFNNLNFTIPSNLTYEEIDNSMLLKDENNKWYTYIELIEGSYEKLFTNKSQIQSIYQKSGYMSSPAIENRVSEVPYITLELLKSGKNIILGIAKLNDNYLYGITLYNENNEYNYKILESISSILESVEYTETIDINTSTKKELNEISKISK